MRCRASADKGPCNERRLRTVREASMSRTRPNSACDESHRDGDRGHSLARRIGNHQEQHGFGKHHGDENRHRGPNSPHEPSPATMTAPRPLQRPSGPGQARHGGKRNHNVYRRLPLSTVVLRMSEGRAKIMSGKDARALPGARCRCVYATATAPKVGTHRVVGNRSGRRRIPARRGAAHEWTSMNIDPKSPSASRRPRSDRRLAGNGRRPSFRLSGGGPILSDYCLWP